MRHGTDADGADTGDFDGAADVWTTAGNHYTVSMAYTGFSSYAVAGAASPTGQLERVVRQFAISHARGNTGARVVNYELAALSPAHLEEIAGLRRAIEQELRDVVEDGVRRGAFTTSNPRMTALALLSLGIDVARWFRDEGEWDPEDVAAHYCELALNMVGAISR